MAHPIKTAPWFLHEEYPFDEHYLDLPQGRMHYVDEGEGDPIIWVHGTPSWSFLYRHQIQAFSKTHRCIVPDHIGFGLSEKSRGLTPAEHAENLEALVDHLGLKNYTLVVHDFGGPIGLSLAAKYPERIQRMVILNTWLWETASDPAVQKIDRLVNSWLGRLLYYQLNFSSRVLLPQGFYDKKKLTAQLKKHYATPFASSKDRRGPYFLAQALAGSSSWYAEQMAVLDRLQDKPCLLVWGKHDRFLSLDYLDRWKVMLPNAQVKILEVGHFLQEEKPKELNQFIQSFLSNFQLKDNEE